MRDKIILNAGEKLRHERSRSKGTMGQTDIYTYSVVNENDDVVGSVTHTDTTALNGFKQTQSVIQKDASGNVIVDESW